MCLITFVGLLCRNCGMVALYALLFTLCFQFSRAYRCIWLLTKSCVRTSSMLDKDPRDLRRRWNAFKLWFRDSTPLLVVTWTWKPPSKKLWHHLCKMRAICKQIFFCYIIHVPISIAYMLDIHVSKERIQSISTEETHLKELVWNRNEWNQCFVFFWFGFVLEKNRLLEITISINLIQQP